MAAHGARLLESHHDQDQDQDHSANEVTDAETLADPEQELALVAAQSAHHVCLSKLAFTTTCTPRQMSPFRPVQLSGL